MSARVSVIVPVRNRREMIAGLLDALQRQTYRDFEIVVVDDGSTDGTPEVILQRQRNGQPVRVMASSGTGAVAARRDGVGGSSGSILAFTDSDCVPDAGWLAAGVWAIDGGAEMVNGLTRPARHVEPFERSTASDDDGLYPTCNMFFQRDTFERFGGFDEHAVTRLGFRPERRSRGLGFGEDTLLAWRIRRAGVPFAYAPDAIVEHLVLPRDFGESLSRSIQAGAFPALLREVPELREKFVRKRILFGSRSRLPFYATALAFLARRRLAVCVFVAWWGWCRASELRSMPISRLRKLVFLPAEMALDAVVGTSLVIGSIRGRTLLL